MNALIKRVNSKNVLKSIKTIGVVPKANLDKIQSIYILTMKRYLYILGSKI